ncbi:MAG: CHAP domain-containing protein [Acutalibacteraceae bacterium]
MTFSKRLTSPGENNKNYIHYSKGGLNRCIEIKNGSCLPNCVGYCWGRWYELLGERPMLSRGNAENWYSYTGDGYKRGIIPKLGAVICFKKGEAHNYTDGAGHVAVVEKINSDGSIVTSNSMFGGSRFYTQTLLPPLYSLNDKSYIFQGFIYPPVTFESEKLYPAGDWRVTDASLLHVRKGPSTKYEKKTYAQLTKGAKKQIYELVRKKADGYVLGVEFTVFETKNNWGRTPSGWVCLDYCTKIEDTK